MGSFAKPKLVVSQCIEFDHCRYNGDLIHHPTIRKLMNHVDFLPVCPEVEIGLGTPRETIRIVLQNGEQRLVQPKTNRDVTGDMEKFSVDYLHSLPHIDGFILKSRSPSCGLKEVKLYTSTEKGPAIGSSSGLFGGKVQKIYPHLAVEDEGRLNNFLIRERFFTKIFLLAAYRELKREGSVQKLTDFHNKNKYLFLAYSRPTQKLLTRILKNKENYPADVLFMLYEKALRRLFLRTARYDSSINAAKEMAKAFDKDLNEKEKLYFLELTEKVAEKKEPFSSVMALLKSWACRFDDEELLRQSWFEPYPGDLLEISDSGKGRDY
ncbi:YbgA family protein [Fictibacillus sp. NRS-1165]|uniref:YbgA family protein n=1 Tax=Fictibacillus sp. NRS-1165 TaxID=3144463 RepID=UPI003D22D7B3